MNKILFEVLNSLSWLYQLINSKLAIEPAILQGVTIGLITILIPMFIAQLNSDSDFGKLDIWVVFDHILGFYKFIFIAALSFSLTILWSIPTLNQLKLPILFLWILCNYSIIRRLLNFYYWIKGEKNELRLSYLKSVNKEEDIKFAFSSIWEVKDIGFNWMQQFLEAFIDKLNDLNKEKKNSTVSNMLLDFENNITNIKPSLSYKSIRYLLENMLSLYYEFSLLSEQITAKDNDSKLYFDMSRFYSRKIITDIEEITLENWQSEIFFSQLEKFVNKHLKEEKTIKFLFQPPGIVETLFDNTDTDSFNGFPRNWAITFETVEANNLISHILFYIFSEWAQDRLGEPIEKSSDMKAEIIAQNLFPDVELGILSNCFILLFSDRKDRPMEWAVKTEWGFGKIPSYIGTVKFYYGEDLEKYQELINREIEERRNKTFVLIATLIKKGWILMQPSSLEILEKYKEELENLKFDEESPEEYTRKEYLKLVTKLIEELKNKIET
jgi:hypothetical protein